VLWPAFLLKGVHGASRAGPRSGAAEGVVVVMMMMLTMVVLGCPSGWECDWAVELARGESREGNEGGTSVVGIGACTEPEVQS